VSLPMPERRWLHATQGMTLLADAGARFADDAALLAWARRAWAHYGHDAPAALVPWASGRRLAVSLVNAEGKGAQTDWADAAPLWAGALALALQELPALRRQGRVLVAEGTALTVIDVAAGAIVHWQLVWLEGADAALLASWADGAPASPVLALGHSLAGEPPRSVRAPRPLNGARDDFVATLPAVRAPRFAATPARLARRWAWAFAAVAVLAFGVALIDAHEAWQQSEAALAALAEAARPARREAARSAAPTREANATAARDAAAADRARLAQPWAARFAVAEAAAPVTGHWLRLEQPRSGPLRLAGSTASPDEAFALAQRLLNTPGVADLAVLRSERSSESRATAAPARFEIAITLREGAPR
jgi:hypothetical protein